MFVYRKSELFEYRRPEMVRSIRLREGLSRVLCLRFVLFEFFGFFIEFVLNGRQMWEVGNWCHCVIDPWRK